MQNKQCKICKIKIPIRRIYCSNKCKFSDAEYNKSRKHSITNDSTKKIKCINCSAEFADIHNLSGILTRHCKTHGIEFNFSLFEIIEAEIIPVFECLLSKCDWTTIDLTNKSGWFTIHLKNKHQYTPEQFMEEFPKLKYLWEIRNAKVKRDKLMEKAENRIICQICKKSFLKLSNSHLKKHDITPSEYKKLYNIEKTTSDYTSKLQASKVDRKALSETIKRINQEKWGVNSYTQTEEGKNRILQTALKRNFKNYLNSSTLQEVAEILFTEQDYTGVVGKKYPFRCKQCQVEFLGSLENGKLPRCLECYPIVRGGPSKLEKEIFLWLQTVYSKDLIKNTQKILSSKKELDIYFPENKIGIEINGLYWHSELNGKDKHYHLDKTLDCEKQNVRLIHIFEDEWIQTKSIVQNRLLNILGLQFNRVYARQCEIRELSIKDKNDFLIRYHLQGADKSKVKLGIFFENSLLAVMTFSNYKYKKSPKSVFELSRFAVGEINVVGGFSRLLKYFIRQYTPSKIISFADRRWVDRNNNVYLTNNFELDSIVAPSYWYIKNVNRVHRFNYRKKLLNEKLRIFNSDLTEWQNMQLNGYDRIWDCGNMKYILEINKEVIK